MRKTAAIMLLLLFLLSMTANKALANAMPAYIEADPGLELAVDEGCPITVDKEDLVFDLSGGISSLTSAAKVTASYVMTNPSDEAQHVMMAFPYVAKLGDEASYVKQFRVFADGSELKYETFYGSKIKNDIYLKKLEFRDVLSNFMLESPPEPDDGLVYSFEIDRASIPDELERVHIRVALGRENGKCFTSGFSGGTFNEDGTAEIYEWFYLNGMNYAPMRVFVSGGSLEKCSAAAYESYDSKEPIEGVGITIKSEPASFRSFAYESFDTQRFYSGVTLEEKTYWALLDELNRNDIYEAFNGIVPMLELFGKVAYDSRLAVGVFYVDFKPNETRNITVNSTVDASIKRPTRLRDVTTKYTYTYLSNPAKSWADFGTLRITVIPPGRRHDNDRLRTANDSCRGRNIQGRARRTAAGEHTVYIRGKNNRPLSHSHR